MRSSSRGALPLLIQVARRIDRFINAIGKFAYWIVLVMIGVGVWNVLGRYIGNAIGQNLSSNGLIETQWYLFDIVFLFIYTVLCLYGLFVYIHCSSL